MKRKISNIRLLIISITMLINNNVIASNFEEFCGIGNGKCRLDLGYIHDFSKSLSAGNSSNSDDFGDWFIYARRDTIQDQYILKGKLSGIIEAGYTDRENLDQLDGTNIDTDEGFITAGAYWASDGTYDPEDLPPFGYAGVIRLSSHDTLDENSNFTIKLVHEQDFQNKNSDYIIEGGYTFSDWTNSVDGDSVYTDIQFRKGIGRGLRFLNNYFTSRIVFENFMPTDSSLEDQTTISIQPLIWRGTTCEISRRVNWLKVLKSTCELPIYVDAIVGRDKVFNKNGTTEDNRSYYAMIGLSLSFNGKGVGGGGGSGGRYFRP